MKRILIVKLWALGDILLATPLLRALKREWPDAEIDWLVDTDYANILRGNPILHEVIAFDSGTWRRHYRYGRWAAYWQLSRALRRNLASRRFDIVINLNAEKWWAAWFLAAPLRIGLFNRAKPGLVGRLYTTAVANSVRGLHNTRHYLKIAEALGIMGPFDERMAFGVRPEDRAAAQAFLESEPGYDPQKPFVILHPGTSQPSKCWSPEQFAEVTAALGPRYQGIITGSPGERELAARIVNALPPGAAPPLIAAGKLANLLQSAALMERAAAVVTGDTSALHIASALNVPLVGIYGSTRPGANAPLFGNHVLLYDDAIPCAPCHKDRCPLHGAEWMRCQKSVTPAQVLTALKRLGV